jgi:hypothetical protein
MDDRWQGLPVNHFLMERYGVSQRLSTCHLQIWAIDGRGCLPINHFLLERYDVSQRPPSCAPPNMDDRWQGLPVNHFLMGRYGVSEAASLSPPNMGDRWQRLPVNHFLMERYSVSQRLPTSHHQTWVIDGRSCPSIIVNHFLMGRYDVSQRLPTCHLQSLEFVAHFILLWGRDSTARLPNHHLLARH